MNETDRNKLWTEYSIHKTPEIREKLIIEYSCLVKIVAGRLCMYLGHNVEFDDLVGCGIFGLIDAIDKFDYSKGIKFETYGSLRIRGAILDQIRKMDWIPRGVREKQRKLESVYRKIEEQQGRTATDAEISAELEISLEELEQWQSQSKVFNLVSLDEYLEQGSEIRMDAKSNTSFEQPEKVIEKQDLKNILTEALDKLTEKERKVIILYYYEELTLKEISLILEVSESRISQLHTKALQKLKSKLGSTIDFL